MKENRVLRFHRKLSAALLLTMFLIAATQQTGKAQVLYGSIVGSVTDSSGAAIQGAEVKVTQRETNETREATTNEAGGYTLSTVLHSHEGEINILPALPKAWPAGNVKGLRARGGVEVDIALSGGRVTECKLRPTVTGHYRLRLPEDQRIINTETNPAVLDLPGGQAHPIRCS